MAPERPRLLRAVVLHWPLAAGRADQRDGLPRCALRADPIPVVAVAGGARVGRLQQSPVARVFHHDLRRRPRRADHRAGDVAGAVDAVQADQSACSASRPRDPSTFSCSSGSCFHRDARRCSCSRPVCSKPQPHLRGTRRRQLDRLEVFALSMVVRRRRLGCGDADYAAAPACRAARRVRADRAGAAVVRARRRQRRRVHRARHLAVFLA